MDAAADLAKEKAQQGMGQAAQQADRLADTVDAVATSLSQQNREGLAEYARKLSQNLTTLAGHLQTRSVDELIDDAKQLARNNPSMFLLGSIAIGFGLTRFLRASDGRDEARSQQSSGDRADAMTQRTAYPEPDPAMASNDRDAGVSETPPWDAVYQGSNQPPERTP